MQTFVDTSVTPGTITIGSPLLVAGYSDGLPFTVRLANKINGPTLLNFNGMGPRAIVHNGGGPLQRGDYRAGELVDCRYNAAANTVTMLTPVSEALINTPIIRTIGGFNPDFLDFYEAIIWLSRRRISNTGHVTFQHAAGVGTGGFVYAQDIRFNHADQARVSIKGRPLNGSLPSAAAMVCTGFNQAARVSNTATNLDTLRGVFTTEIKFVAGARFIVTGDLSVLQDILFTSDGSGPVKTNIFQGYGADNIFLEGGNQNIQRIASFGAQQFGMRTERSKTNIGEQCFFIGNGFAGVQVGGDVLVLQNGSLAALSNGVHGVQISGSLGSEDFATAQIYARGNVNSGVSVNGGSLVGSNNSVSRDNGLVGVAIINNGSGNLFAFNVSGNVRGVLAGQGGYIDAANVTGSATGEAFYAYNDAFISRAGSSVTGSPQSSPALNTLGNGNSFIT